MPAEVLVGANTLVPMVCQAPLPPPKAVNSPPTIDKPGPVMSVMATSEPISKLVMLVVVARMVSETRLVMVDEAVLITMLAAVLVGLNTLISNSSQAPLVPVSAVKAPATMLKPEPVKLEIYPPPTSS